jgi:hypothetical protein
MDRQPVAKPQATSTLRCPGWRRLSEPNDKLIDDRLGELSTPARDDRVRSHERQRPTFDYGFT